MARARYLPMADATRCAYEWRLPHSNATAIPTGRSRHSYQSFFLAMNTRGVNSTKNVMRVDICDGKRAYKRQQWQLHVRTPERTLHIESLAHARTAERYLRCTRSKVVAFVGDSFPLQTWLALTRSLQATRFQWRWLNERVGQLDWEPQQLAAQGLDYEVAKLHFDDFGSTLRFHRANVFVERDAMSIRSFSNPAGYRVRAAFVRVFDEPCADIYVLQTGNWFATRREWPARTSYIDVVDYSMRFVRERCPLARVIWFPPSAGHGGHGCEKRERLMNASDYERFLSSRMQAVLTKKDGHGKNANVALRHRSDLLRFANGSLEVVDLSLAGQARADSHFDARDMCNHWCLPGPPDTFGALLIEHLCAGRGASKGLPDPRTCLAV